MNDMEKFVDAGNIKFKTGYREAMYFKMRDEDKTNLFRSITEIFYNSFAIGYHFDKQKGIAPKSINHVNLVSFERDIKEFMVRLILKRKPNIKGPKDLWAEVEKYAEYGIVVLFDSWQKNNKTIVIKDILE